MPAQSPRSFSDGDATKFLRQGYASLNAGKLKDAGACCALVLKYRPKVKEAHFLVGLIAIEAKDWPTAKRAFKSVVAIDETHTAAWAQLARTFVILGQYSNGASALAKAVALKPSDPLVQDVVGTVHSLLGDQKAALDWYERACEGSKAAGFQLSRAKSLIFLGKLTEAKAALETVIAQRPNAAQAHWLLSRVQTAVDDRHIKVMQTLADAEPSGSHQIPFFQYAIGKEREDLADWAGAFQAYQAGAIARRKEISFDETAEIAMFNALEQNFTPNWLSNQKEGHPDASPIFIVGQPRTGTTLVERIITAHSDVSSAGELQQFGMAIKRLLGISSPKPMTAQTITAAARDIDPKELAALYLKTTRSLRPTSKYFVDKLPVNYLYAPLIMAAFPNAHIIHLVRGAADSCFSSYKQLFADAYFHSYDQKELARHHVRYRHLMQHWRTLLGKYMLDVSYEETVVDLEASARKIIDFLGLEWQEACLEFHRQDTAVTTASAVQVRETAHRRSVGRWQEYREYLEPTLSILRAANILEE